MRTLTDSTGTRVENKFPVKIRIQDSVNGVMNKPISHACLVNVARLRIINFESLIAAVPVVSINEILMKWKNIIHKINRKLSNIFPLFFTR